MEEEEEEEFSDESEKDQESEKSEDQYDKIEKKRCENDIFYRMFCSKTIENQKELYNHIEGGINYLKRLFGEQFELIKNYIGDLKGLDVYSGQPIFLPKPVLILPKNEIILSVLEWINSKNDHILNLFFWFCLLFVSDNIRIFTFKNEKVSNQDGFKLWLRNSLIPELNEFFAQTSSSQIIIIDPSRGVSEIDDDIRNCRNFAHNIAIIFTNLLVEKNRSQLEKQNKPLYVLKTTNLIASYCHYCSPYINMNQK